MEEVLTHPEVGSLGPISVRAAATKKPGSQRRLSVLDVHSGNLFGGIERAILTSAENLHVAPSISFEFALCFPGKFTEELAAAGQTVHKLPEVRVRNPFSIVAARRHLARLLEQKQYDVVLCHSPWAHSIFAPVIRRSGIPELFWAHANFSGKQWLERWARRSKPQFVISNSDYSDESISRIFPSVPHHVLRCPVPSTRVVVSNDLRSRLRAELTTLDDTVVIIQVSRMEPWKGHDLLLDAAAKIRRDLPWIVWFVGGAQREAEQNYLAALKAKAGRLGITERIRFAGERADVPHLMAAADIFCQPNRVPEPFGLVFVEALSQGLPVVTFAVGGPAEIVDETCGVLLPAGSTDTLKSQLEYLILGGNLRRKLGEAGPARAKALCDPAVILPQLEAVLSQLSTANRI
jgi:glycosyltransferase involved in cell wall biosynthesis